MKLVINMYTVMKDSLFEPQKIINHQKKSLLYLAFYILILSLFMSLSAILYYAGYRENSVMTDATTGCELDGNVISCTSTAHDPSTAYDLYGISFFLLDESENVSMISDLGSQAIVLQGSDFLVYSNSNLYMKWNVSTMFSSLPDINSFFTSLRTSILISMILVNVLANIFILVLMILISTIPFNVLKRFMSYRDRFVLVGFSLTPVAFILTFYYLFQRSILILIFLLLFGYRSLTIMRNQLLIKYLMPPVTNAPTEATQEEEDQTSSTSQEDEDDEQK